MATLKETYFQWLLDTGQEEIAGEVREKEGDYLGAVNLYMKGGLPTRAAKLMATHTVSIHPGLIIRMGLYLSSAAYSIVIAIGIVWSA